MATALGQGGLVKFCSVQVPVTSHTGRELWHSCVIQLVLGYGLSGSGKLLNHASSQVGKSCVSAASAIFQRGNEVVTSSATGKKGPNAKEVFPSWARSLCCPVHSRLPSPCPCLGWRSCDMLGRQCRDGHRSHLRLSPRSHGTEHNFEAGVTAPVLCDTQNAGRAAPAQVTGSAGLCTPVSCRRAVLVPLGISSRYSMELLSSSQPLHWLCKYFLTGIDGFITTAVLQHCGFSSL